MYLILRQLVVSAALWMTALSLLVSPRAKHVFIVSIDGGKPAVIAQSAMPVLKRLAEEGACTWAASTIYPSLTLPSHTSMLTGVGPDKHHVLWNSWKPRKGVVGVPTIFRAVTTYDTAATGLWLLGVPVPEAFDGQPVISAFGWQGDQFAAPVQTERAGRALGL
jgi:predicted AlkP superfamily pyrophosphatase or phosphodiesterase